MREKKISVYKIALVGILTALAAVLGAIKIPILGVSVTLVLPVVIIGAALCGPVVGAWLTVIPNVIAFGEAGVFMVYSPVGCVATLLLKGIIAGAVAGLVFRALSKKSPTLAVACSSVATPLLNTGIFIFGCYLFIWDELVALAGESGVGIGLLILGLGVINCIIELVLNLILCPSILHIIEIARKNKGEIK